MAAVQDGQLNLEVEKDIKTEITNDGSGNINVNSSSPGSTSSGGKSKSPAGSGEDQQTLLAVLQFLKRNKLTESVDILRREAGLSADADDSPVSESAGAGSGGVPNVSADGGDANSLLSRVSMATPVAPPATAAPKGLVRSHSKVMHIVLFSLLASYPAKIPNA